MASRLPLGLGQEQLWFLHELTPDNPTYNICHGYRLRGSLDVAVLRRAFEVIVGRHDALRATFGAADGVPFQEVAPDADVRLDAVDLIERWPDPVERERAVDAILSDEVDRPFDLRAGVPYRIRLLRVAEDEHVLLISFHHMITDGWSCGILYRELSEVYAALVAGRPVPELPSAGSYVETVRWQRDQRSALDEDLKYWEGRLTDVPTVDLPADRARPAVPSHRGDQVRLPVPDPLVGDLRAAARDRGVSLLMLLTTAVTTVLARYTGQEDIPLGVSMLGRTEPEHESVVGLFANMVVLRTPLDGQRSLAEHLERVADTMLDAYDHQGAPFGMVVERVRPVRDASRNPLFQVCVQLQGAGNSGDDLRLAGIDTVALQMPVTRSRFDLTLNFVQSGDDLRVDAEYATDLFDRWRVTALLHHVLRALRVLCDDPDVTLANLPLMDDDERDRVLAAGRAEPSGIANEPVHVAVSRVARRDPAAVAAVCRDRQITYGELDERSSALACYLRGHGVGHETVVGVALRRDIEVLVALLGVAKAGAAYVILDPEHPADRLSYLLADTAAPVVLTAADAADRVPVPDGVRLVRLDEDWSTIAAATGDRPESATGDSLIYVLYTSGSTGRPKGVRLEHRALLSFAVAYGRAFDLGPTDRMLQFSALSFDMSQGEIFAGLLAGATLVLVPPESGTPDGLAALIEQDVTFISLSPAMLALVSAGPYQRLRKIQSGGDVLPAEVVAKWSRPDRLMINMYGPTEAAVACTAFVIDGDAPSRTAPPIGRPMLDRRMYVVDRWGNLTPSGVPGELLIGGDEGLARDYLNLPELTAARFIADPFRPTGRVYRSGDLVRWTSSWQLEFLGRIDTQVKVNGIRIELEEIEAALLTHPHVAMAAVAVRPDASGEKRLVGYLSPVGDTRPTSAELRRHLTDQLPEYMVPTSWLVLDELPLTTARKVDRAALPTPDLSVPDVDENYTAPATDTEVTVAEIFAEVLARPRVGATDNLFELGGGSMHAMRAVSRLNKAFGIRLNVRSLYGSGTVRSIASGIDSHRAAQGQQR